ncbi:MULTISPECIES: hypothetical protein [Deefgea]|uniref:Uncharacterized protein n=1 Tax=Deefgea chitinilytica TaxID=570276 RepID=A0ABS2CEM6_9NEIS|nr:MULTISPECIES: hypothetical protein [Deefgea]MBM5572517.1 hypothetical protein [Deefgea chitinilytica]MBM9889753.1 hypothetical protein [Deefgea sp. CFH1-16]
MKKNFITILASVISFSLFVFISANNKTVTNTNKNQGMDRIVIPATLQIILAAGDPFLAANFEAIRAASTWSGNNAIDTLFRLRVNSVIAQLNPCHEDNYYNTNALLSWGGSPKEGSSILKKAMKCRYWDDIPAFFYGFNRHYFFNETAEAKKAILTAADRSDKKSVMYKKIAIMIEAGTLSNNEAALAFLKDQKNKSTDNNLKALLEKRILRLTGLITLQNAQKTFESKYKKPLTNPFDLFSSGVLTAIPHDPLGLGYEFENGQFQLKQFKFN